MVAPRAGRLRRPDGVGGLDGPLVGAEGGSREVFIYDIL